MGLHIKLANPPVVLLQTPLVVLLQTASILNYGNNVTERGHINTSPGQSLKLRTINIEVFHFAYLRRTF
jgi:hypothetical protein